MIFVDFAVCSIGVMSSVVAAVLWFKASYIEVPDNDFGSIDSNSGTAAGSDSIPHSILIAGGIGITPIWAMVQALQAAGRSWELYFSCRSRGDMAFFDVLRGMTYARLHFDDEANGAFLDIAAIAAGAPKGAHFYCCGRTPMLKAFEDAMQGRPPEQVHVEYFTPKEQPNLAGGYVVVLARSGRECQFPLANRFSPCCAMRGSTCPIPAKKASAVLARPP